MYIECSCSSKVKKNWFAKRAHLSVLKISAKSVANPSLFHIDEKDATGTASKNWASRICVFLKYVI